MSENTPKDVEITTCSQCGGEVRLNSKFCNYCGSRLSANSDDFGKSWTRLKEAALFYGIDIVACCLASFVGIFKTLGWSLFFDILMAISAILFFAYNWSENKHLLKWKSFSFLKLSGYAAIAICCSVIVHYSVGWLNVVIFNKDENYFELLRGNLAAEVFLIFFTAVMPALFEELGYRGYLLQNLLRIADKDQAIYITSFLFAIIHMSFISLFWLIPFALFLGYTRVKENTLWYGIFIHFFFNLTACVFQILAAH